MRRILLVVSGTTGDAAPMVGLAASLATRYSVVALTHHEYLAAFTHAGASADLGTLPFTPSVLLASSHGQRMMEGGWFGLRRLRGAYGLVRQCFPSLHRTVQRAIAWSDTDFIITTGPTLGVEKLALARGVPVRRVQFQPTWPSNDIRSLYVAKFQPNSRFVIRGENSLVKRGAPLAFRLALRDAELPRGHRPELDESYHLGLTTWFGFPELFGTHSPVTSPARYVGFCRPPEGHFSVSAAEEEDLLAHIAHRRTAHGPLVYIGFGSMRTSKVFRETTLLVRAAGERGYVVAVQSLMHQTAFMPVVDRRFTLLLPPIDHRALFPLMDAVVCHGGLNTCAAALAARKPLVLLPQWLDQYYWAGRCEHLGLGIAARRRVRTLTDAHQLFERFESTEFCSPPSTITSFNGNDNICQDLANLLSKESRSE